MVVVKCNRPGCDHTAEVHPTALTILIPAGWHHHVDGDGRAAFLCSDDCFDLWWAQRRWKQQRRGMTELDVPEGRLLP